LIAKPWASVEKANQDLIAPHKWGIAPAPISG